jgi:hypothetical protein
MHKVFRLGVLAFTLGTLIVVPLTGCSTDQTSEANTAIGAANKQVGVYLAASKAVQGLLSQTDKLSGTPSDAQQGLDLTKQMQTKITEERAAAQAAKAEFAKIEALNVNEKFKTYADKEIAVVDAALKEADVASTTATDLAKIFDALLSGKTGRALTDPIAAVQKDTKALTAAENQIVNLDQAASSYFDQQQLGK